jgi:hypothetical protein
LGEIPGDPIVRSENLDSSHKGWVLEGNENMYLVFVMLLSMEFSFESVDHDRRTPRFWLKRIDNKSKSNPVSPMMGGQVVPRGKSTPRYSSM